MYSLGVFWNKILEFVTEDLNNSMRQFVIKMLICLDPSTKLHPSEGNSIKIYTKYEETASGISLLMRNIEVYLSVLSTQF